MITGYKCLLTDQDKRPDVYLHLERRGNELCKRLYQHPSSSIRQKERTYCAYKIHLK